MSLSWTASTITVMKICWYTMAITFFEFLHITDVQFYILWTLMIVDFILWIWKQYVINKKEITSHRAWLWVIKKVSTLIVFLSIALMFRWIWIDWDFYLNAIVSIFIMSETYSVIQNVYTIRTWKIVTEYDAISKLLIVVSSSIWKAMDNKIDNLSSKKK